MTPEERTTLLDALLDGEISEADFIRLEAELIVDREVRQAYYKRLEMDLLLEQVAAEAVVADSTSASPGRPDVGTTVSTSRGFWLAGMLLSIAAGLILIVTFVPRPIESGIDGGNRAAASPSQGVEPSASGFAIVGGQSDAVWEGNPIRSGALVPEGELHLVSGLVHLELFSGVQMVIRGDAIFSIDSPMQVTMRKGRARAQVPEPAHGFRLKTSAGEVVDLGTEFTIDVDQDRSAVQVVDGEVELRPKDAAVRRLRDGEGVRWTVGGAPASALTEDIGLVGPVSFQDTLAKRQSSQFLRWKAGLEDLREDPRLIAHYSVDPQAGWSRNLVNRATLDHRSGRGPVAGDGAVVAAEPTNDRWGRSGGALDFSRTGSRVRVVVPGEHRGLTLVCWVKINSLDRWYNSLFLTDGHEEREPHWQIMDDGRLFFSVKPPQLDDLPQGLRERQVFYSQPFWNPSMSGQWIMLATVYDVDRKQVTHYVNGKPITVASIPDALLVDSIRIGPASLCNWSEPMYRTDATFVVRNLNGSVDEFALYSGALTNDEISNQFEVGNPNEQ